MSTLNLIFIVGVLNIQIDPNIVYKKVTPFWEGVDISYASYLFKPEIWKKLNEISDAGIKYVRLHEIVRSLSIAKYIDGKLVYDFTLFDFAIRNLLKNNLLPMIILESSPNLMSRKSTSLLHNPFLPITNKLYSSLVINIIDHCVKTFGKEEVSKWYFELWNEPNNRTYYYKGKSYDFVCFSKNVIEQIKRSFPYIKIGGPAISINNQNYFSKLQSMNLFKYYDFFSFHIYNSPEKPINFPELENKIRKTIKYAGNKPIIISEWNMFYSHHSFEDKPILASYALKLFSILKNYNVIQTYFFKVSDYPRIGKPYLYGDLGMFTSIGTKKPIYWLFVLLKNAHEGRFISFNSDSLYGFAYKKKREIGIFFTIFDLEEKNINKMVRIKIHNINNKNIERAKLFYIQSNREIPLLINTPQQEGINSSLLKNIIKYSSPESLQIRGKSSNNETVYKFNFLVNTVGYLKIKLKH